MYDRPRPQPNQVAVGVYVGCVRNSDGLRSVHHDLSSALMLHLFNFSVVKQALYGNETSV